MTKEQKKEEERYIYRRNDELSKTGFTVYELAKNVERELQKRYPEPTHRVRTRLRSRTQLWDVIVKVRSVAKPEQPAVQQ